MQSTFYNPSEVVGQLGRREQCSMQAHSSFAEEVLGEKHHLLPGGRRMAAQPIGQAEHSIRGGVHNAHSVWHGVLTHTMNTQWFYIAWGAEIFWVLFVVMAVTKEMWGSCPFEDTMFVPNCRSCFSTTFVMWTIGLAALWFLHLYFFVLLVSRGFRFHLRHLGRTIPENAAKGIPENALYFFMYLSLVLALWFFAGLVFLIQSNQCLRGGQIFERHHRSQLMFWTTALNVLFGPILLAVGRCYDVSELCKPGKMSEDDGY